MYGRVTLVICATILIIKTVSSQCIGANNPEWSAAPASNSPQPVHRRAALIVTSSSPISPSGLNIAAENLVIEGPLDVTGNLPFLGTVAMDGSIQVDGQSSVVYGCGNGNVGIVNEGLRCH